MQIRSLTVRMVAWISLVAVVTIVGWAWKRSAARTRVQSSTADIQSNDVGSRMTSAMQEGRYEDAIQIGLNALRNNSGDELVYQEIATIYFIRAQKDPKQRDEWVKKGVLYSEKALSLNSKTRDVAGVHLLQHAKNFERAGDLSSDDRCIYYQRARKLLQDRVPLLAGQQLTIDGRSFALAPLRKENEKVLTEVDEKLAQAACGQAVVKTR